MTSGVMRRPATYEDLLRVPDHLVAEIVEGEPKTSKLDRVKKPPRYAPYGVPHAWIMDATAKTLEVYARQDDAFALVATFDGTASVRAEPFDASELSLSAYWIDGE